MTRPTGPDRSRSFEHSRGVLSSDRLLLASPHIEATQRVSGEHHSCVSKRYRHRSRLDRTRRVSHEGRTPGSHTRSNDVASWRPTSQRDRLDVRDSGHSRCRHRFPETNGRVFQRCPFAAHAAAERSPPSRHEARALPTFNSAQDGLCRRDHRTREVDESRVVCRIQRRQPRVHERRETAGSRHSRFWDRGKNTNTGEDIRIAKRLGFEALVIHHEGVTPEKVQKIKTPGSRSVRGPSTTARP